MSNSSSTTPAVGPVAAVAGRSGGAVTVRAVGGAFDLVAGDVDDLERQTVLRGLYAATVGGFAAEVLAHLGARSGRRVSVGFDQPFPVAVAVSDGHHTLNVYDDGADFSLIAPDAGGLKWGTGTGVTPAALERFARTLREHLEPGDLEAGGA